jgi:hypothetical protein
MNFLYTDVIFLKEQSSPFHKIQGYACASASYHQHVQECAGTNIKKCATLDTIMNIKSDTIHVLADRKCSVYFHFNRQEYSIICLQTKNKDNKISTASHK